MQKQTGFRTLCKAFVISVKNRKKISIIVDFIGLFIAFLPSITAVVLKNMTDSIQLLYEKKIKPSQAIALLLVLIGLFLIQVLYDAIKDYTYNVDSKITMIKYIRRKILQNKCEVNYKYIENYDDYARRVTFAESESGKQVASSFQNMINILQNIIVFISIVYLLVKVDTSIVILLLITSVPAAFFSYLQKDELYYHQMKHMKENVLVLFYYNVISAVENAQEIRHSHLFHYLKNRWRTFAKNYIIKKKKLTIKHVVYNSIADLVRSSVYITIILITVKRIYQHPEIGVGVFALVYSLSSKMQQITALLFNQIIQLLTSIPYMEEFFYLDKLEKDKGNDAANPTPPGDIEFSHVKFRYENTTEDVIKDISVTIKKGEKVVIVGENGSGKSTFISLLCGMLQPKEGTIKVNHMDVKEHVAEIRKSISVVFQDFGHYQDSLRHNITVSDKNKKVNDNEIISLAKNIGVNKIIEAQENGLDEEIGTFNKCNKDLSGGQWQKISILRAIYRNDSSIMILDEPTSALDPIAEAQIYRNFTELTGDKTVILISHRLGVTSVANRILVFDNGRIIEDGTHKELMDKGGKYAKMYAAQARWYKPNVYIDPTLES